MAGSRYFSERRAIDNYDDLERRMRSGELQLALEFPPNFSRDVAARIATLTGFSFITAPNKFTALGSLDAMVAAMASVRGLAVALVSQSAEAGKIPRKRPVASSLIRTSGEKVIIVVRG